MTPDDIAALAMTLAACTPMERLTNMEIRSALEFLKGRGYLVRPQPIDSSKNNGDASKCFVCANDGQKETLT
jgi:hypothetical protein